MPRIHVCPLSKIHATVRNTGARSLVTLINVNTAIELPAEIEAERHIFIGVSDITEPMDGHILPGEEHVHQLLAFARRWDRAQPLVIHCYAGVSRSTAAAFIAACALAPHRQEGAVARALRTASPTATPNARLVQVADRILSRDGRMVAAVQAIGRGEDCVESLPFALELS